MVAGCCLLSNAGRFRSDWFRPRRPPRPSPARLACPALPARLAESLGRNASTPAVPHAVLPHATARGRWPIRKTRAPSSTRSQREPPWKRTYPAAPLENPKCRHAALEAGSERPVLLDCPLFGAFRLGRQSPHRRVTGGRTSRDLSRWRPFYAAQLSGGPMRFGRNAEVRPLGGRAGCLAMILISLVASVVLTILANVLVRL